MTSHLQGHASGVEPNSAPHLIVRAPYSQLNKARLRTLSRARPQANMRPAGEDYAQCRDGIQEQQLNPVTGKVIRDLYVMVFLCLQTRELIVTESTDHPDSAWVCEQTKWFAERTKEREKKPEMIIHDRDVNYTKEFTRTVKEAGMKTNPLPKGSPNLNGRCERVIETTKLEYLQRFIIFGKRHMDYLVSEFTNYYNNHRSYMERENLPPICDAEPEEVAVLKLDPIEIKMYVGGLVKSFERRAA